MVLPSLSVIVPSYDGANRLPRLLETIIMQLAPGDEVIVIDDASGDGTAEVAMKYGAMVISLESNGGVGRARNEGAKAARHPVLVFFDDDLLPVDGYLSKVRELFRDSSVNCAQGLHHLEPLDDNPDIWQRTDALIWHHYMATQCVRDGQASVFYSGSFAIRREVFLDLGGFYEGFAGAGGEEFEFSLRLCARYLIVFSEELCTRHHFKRFIPRVRALYRRSQNYPAVSRKGSGERNPLLAGEVLRLVVACAALPLLAMALSSMAPAGLAAAGLLAYLLVDAALYRDLWRWERLHFLPIVIVYRYLQYWTIAAGIATKVLTK